MTLHNILVLVLSGALCEVGDGLGDGDTTGLTAIVSVCSNGHYYSILTLKQLTIKVNKRTPRNIQS